MTTTAKIIKGDMIPNAITEEVKPKITVDSVIKAIIILPATDGKPQYCSIAAPPPENMILITPNIKNRRI